MKGKKQIEEVFSDKLRNLKVRVDPSLWEGVSSRLASFKPPVSITGVPVIIKYIVGVSVAIVVFTSYLLNTSDAPSKKKEVIIVFEKKEEPPTRGAEPAKQKPILHVIKKKKKRAVKNQPDNSKEPVGYKSKKQAPKKAAVVFVTKTKKREVLGPETTTSVVPEKREPQVVLEPEKKVLYKIEGLPNVFTPNNDGKNDRLTIKTTDLYEFSIKIINTQNKLVYRSNDANFKWDGLDLHNNPAPSGSYVYYITARDREGNPIKRYSKLILIR